MKTKNSLSARAYLPSYVQHLRRVSVVVSCLYVHTGERNHDGRFLSHLCRSLRMIDFTRFKDWNMEGSHSVEYGTCSISGRDGIRADLNARQPLPISPTVVWSLNQARCMPSSGAVSLTWQCAFFCVDLDILNQHKDKESCRMCS